MSFWKNIGEYKDFSYLKGQTIVEINKNVETDTITFKLLNGQQYQLAHIQDCCESVYIERTLGDISNILNLPILEAESSSETGDERAGYDSYTDSKFRLETEKGWVEFQWHGTSNGYYSEDVSFFRLKY